MPRLRFTDHNGQSVLHFVASKNNLDVAKMLLNHDPPASTRVRDKRGQYPIHRAAAVGSIPMTRLLINNKSPLDATDTSGYTALHHAVAEGHGMCNLCHSFIHYLTFQFPGDAAVALLKAGADYGKKDQDGCLALDLAPDKEVGCVVLDYPHSSELCPQTKPVLSQVRRYIERAAEGEGIDL